MKLTHLNIQFPIKPSKKKKKKNKRLRDQDPYTDDDGGTLSPSGGKRIRDRDKRLEEK